MRVRIEVGKRRYHTNVHDAAVLVARGDAIAITSDGKRAIDEYTQRRNSKPSKGTMDKRAKVAARSVEHKSATTPEN